MPFTGSSLTAMQTLLNTLWSVIQALFSGVGDVVEVILANPLLLIPTGVAFAYACVKLIRRFIVSF